MAFLVVPINSRAATTSVGAPLFDFEKASVGKILDRTFNKLEEYGFWPVAMSLGVLYCLSVVQKDNPDFFASVVRTLESPLFLMQRRMQKFFCEGKSLTWNEVASWHNRVVQLLTPLTKTTSVIDLSKDRRLRSMDQEDDQNGGQDLQWGQQVAHIEREFTFLKKVLTHRLRYYKDVRPQTKEEKIKKLKEELRQGNVVRNFKSLGKKVVRTSLTRNEEIAFGLEEATVYLREIVEYCKSVPQFSALDKEHLKRLMNTMCSTCKHLGVLVDEVTAADRTKKKIPMSADGELTRGYTGGSSYSDGYSSYGMRDV